MGATINVQILHASNLGGTYPFVVVCFDNDLAHEVYKTAATNGGPTCVWNETFPLDLTSNVKAILADNKPEPTYLTFFIFDTGAPGIPSLGSAGVLLSTVHDTGIAKGDFPIVNGTGTLSLVVESENFKRSWYQTDAAKIAGVAGAVGVGAIAAGLTAMAINNKKKKKDKRNTSNSSVGAPDKSDGLKQKMKNLLPGTGASRGVDDDSSSSSSSDGNPNNRSFPGPVNGSGHARETSRGYQGGETARAYPGPEPALGYSAGRSRGLEEGTSRGIPSATRPWWDPETDDEEESDVAARTHDRSVDPVEAPDQDANDSVPYHYPQGAPTFDGQPTDAPTSVHIHYHDGSAPQSGYSADNDTGGDAYQQHVHLHEGRGEYGGTFIEENTDGTSSYVDTHDRE